VCNMHVRLCSGRSNSVPSLYAHLPQRLHRRLVSEIIHVSFMYGACRRCLIVNVLWSFNGITTPTTNRIQKNNQGDRQQIKRHFFLLRNLQEEACASCGLNVLVRQVHHNHLRVRFYLRRWWNNEIFWEFLLSS